MEAHVACLICGRGGTRMTDVCAML